MKKQNIELQKDLFSIPIDDESCIIYMPLRNIAFKANNKTVDVINQYLLGCEFSANKDSNIVIERINSLSQINTIEPSDDNYVLGRSVVIILSQVCNLACTYCFAQEARSKEIIEKGKLQSIYDHALSIDAKSTKRFSFIGGGEPLVTWDIIEWSINYINSNKHEDCKINYSIITNATLFNDHIIRFAKQNKIHFGISFEVLKDIQDSQRPFYKSSSSTFDIIHNNLIRLSENEISFSIRSTITKLNVSRMPEMIKFAADNYTIKNIHFEQVTDVNQNDEEFYSDFIHYFFEARKIGKEKGIEVFNSISKSINKIRKRFCNGEMCVTPTGSIVACHRVSSKNDKSYNLFHYGDINDGNVVIHDNKYTKYIKFRNHQDEDCDKCYAKWHCAGMCPMEKDTLTQEQLMLKCDFIKTIIKQLLLDRLE